MTLKEGGRDPKQNPSPASLTSLLISAQITTHFSAVLESPFSPTHQKLLTHIEATVCSPSSKQALLWQIHYSVRGEPWKILPRHLAMWLPASLLCPSPRDEACCSPAGQGLRSHLCFTGVWGGSVKESAFFTRKGNEFQQLSRGKQGLLAAPLRGWDGHPSKGELEGEQLFVQ